MGKYLRRGTRTAMTSWGYNLILNRSHPRAMHNGYIHKAILLGEKALGKPLPLGAEMHHVNGIKDDDSSGNHVICQDRAYHMLLHQRMRALKVCGNAKWMKCAYCKQYDDPANMYVRKSGSCQAWHRKCHTNTEKRRMENGRTSQL